jgi:cell wall-associated NlpC family hydrolase
VGNKETKRLQILAVAKQQVAAGAHYLRGGCGNTPGFTDGYKGDARWASLENVGDYDRLAVVTAELWNRRCLGRYQAVSGEKLPPGDTTKNAIKDYIATQSAFSSDPLCWFPMRGFWYPRRINGAGSSIYLGESCYGRRHFDCLGLVNWAIGQNLSIQPTYDVPVWDKGAKGLADVFDPPDVKDLENADVVIRLTWKTKSNEDGTEEKVVDNEHMGLVSKEGQVIEAANDGDGVRFSPYKREKWTRVARIRSTYF